MNINPLRSSSAASASDGQPLVLKEGQMVHGKVQQLFPGQMAKVQIGGHQLYAKLEVPMQAGDAYYFQVNGTEPDLQLKVVAGPIRGSEGRAAQISQLLEAMQLPRTAEMQEVVMFAVKNKIPMTKENFLNAAAILQTVPPESRANALLTIQNIAQLRLPLTPEVFQSLFQMQINKGMHSQLASLAEAIRTDVNVPAALRETINSSLQTIAKPLTEQIALPLLKQALNLALQPDAPKEQRFAALQLLKSAEVVPQRASLANITQVLTELIAGSKEAPVTAQATPPPSPGNSAMIHTLLKQFQQLPVPEAQAQSVLQELAKQIATAANLSPEVKGELQDAITAYRESAGTEQSKAALIRMISMALLQQTIRPAGEPGPVQLAADSSKAAQEPLFSLLHMNQAKAEQLMPALVRTAEQSPNQSIQQMLQSIEASVSGSIDGQQMKEAMRTVFQSLGANYEAALLGKDPTMHKLAESLKPQLLSLLQEPSISPALRETAETLVMRLNGPLLQTGEVGIQHQLVMQLPLQLLGRTMDATLQWNGRMKEDGKIDPAFARILFYLDLEMLSTTLIDMQVQNHVVHLTIFNDETNLKQIGAHYQPRLKEGLEQAGYTLSGISYKPYTEKRAQMERPIPQTKLDGGVDFRV